MSRAAAAQQAADAYARDLRRNRVVTIVVIVAALAIGVALLSSLSFRLGLTPEAEVLRRGTAVVDGCTADPTTFNTVYRCRATVESWEPEDTWVQGRLTFDDAREIVIDSPQAVTGTVEITSHRQVFTAPVGGARGGARATAEVVVTGWRPAASGAAVGAVAVVVVVPVGVGLAAGWALHRRAQRRFVRATQPSS